MLIGTYIFCLILLLLILLGYNLGYELKYVFFIIGLCGLIIIVIGATIRLFFP